MNTLTRAEAHETINDFTGDIDPLVLLAEHWGLDVWTGHPAYLEDILHRFIDDSTDWAASDGPSDDDPTGLTLPEVNDE
jgi:hypothetical protein